MTFALNTDIRTNHPVDRVELLASHNEWAFNRQADDEIMIAVAGKEADYRVSINWMEDLEALHIGCSFDLPLPSSRKAEVLKLLSLINEQLWIGHFDFWGNENLVMFRQSLMLTGGLAPSESQVEALLNTALVACERYFQAFHYTVWGEKTAQDALACALFETKGNA